MDLELSEDEGSLAEAFGQVLARESATDRVRAAEAAGFDPGLWKVLTGMGAIGMALPESAGGAGGGLVSLVLAAEAAGRHLACVPLVEAAAAALVLTAAADARTDDWQGAGAPHAAGQAVSAQQADGQQAGAPRDGGQECRLPLAVDADGPPVVLAPRPAVDGVAVAVPGGAVACAVVALDGDELVLAHGAPGGAVRDLGFLAVADRPLRGEGVERVIVADGNQARGLWDLAVGWWRLGTAAACAGLAGQALEVGAGYARTRQQFGVPIGSFQAIQQMLADPAMAADGALLLAREAAWRHDHGLDSWRPAADIAYAHAAETAVRAAEACLHVHGGYGYTLDYDAQLYLRRAKALLLLGGDPEAIWQRIGTATAEGGH
jgi:alkylation response protein AidB-like acyl-CoA dehydrogenase